MSQRRWKEHVERDKDLEGQFYYNDGVSTVRTFLHPKGRFLQIWNMIFVVLCVIAVSVDPLFLYVPVINEDKKCIELDKTLRITAICFRAVTDLIYVVNAILQFYSPYIDNTAQKLGSPKLVTDASKTARRYLQGYFLIDILAILPLPQVVIPLFFTKMRGSKSLNTRILLNSAVLFQYVPRILRFYLLRKKLTEIATDVVIVIWAKAAFKFSLYILASNVLGACWYFFSIERETACWHLACEHHIGCVRSSFKCDTNLGNYTFLNDFCTVNTRDTTLFNYGIFGEALESGILESRDFPQKFAHCFWWGLQNLSSLGQNLRTSTYFWENCFAVFISFFGLLVFLSLVGTLQTFIQLETERRWKNMCMKKKEKRRKTKGKERGISLWMSRHNLPDNLKKKILRNVQRIMEVSPDIDMKNPLPYLPAELRKDILHNLCLPLLKKVPTFGKMDELLDAMCDHLKPVLYTEKSYIVREGDPVVDILFIMRGKLLTTTTNGGRTDFFNSEYLEAGDFCGQELLALCLDPHSSSNLPISTRTVQALSDVEAFALKADDLKFVVSKFQWLHGRQFSCTYRLNSQQWRTWAACFIQAAWRRYCKRKFEKSLRVAENRLQDALAANALRALWRYGTRKARMPVRFPS